MQTLGLDKLSCEFRGGINLLLTRIMGEEKVHLNQALKSDWIWLVVIEDMGLAQDCKSIQTSRLLIVLHSSKRPSSTFFFAVAAPLSPSPLSLIPSSLPFPFLHMRLVTISLECSFSRTL